MKTLTLAVLIFSTTLKDTVTQNAVRDWLLFLPGDFASLESYS